MAIDAFGNTSATYYSDPTATSTTTTENKSVLGKDDFLTLLLVELQYQDPTEPMDSEKILSQTSQLATLEASENTNQALEDLAASLSSSQQFSTVAAIGKIADTGSNAIVLDETGNAQFEMYFETAVANGSVEILDVNGNVVDTFNLEESEGGIQAISWDGNDANGQRAAAGFYYVNATFRDADNELHETRVGRYPIESVRFEDGEALLKLGSSYVPFNSVAEIAGEL